ncbi:MAG: hypothetical protein QM619_00840 [Micropruina sp.]|uniref:hypothetical protein n=1 Tax=Micropruina sp. TaxID=2737536 RepID=UPI0039E3CC14
MFRSLREFKNPATYFGRFIVQFALAFSACVVAAVIAFALGRDDLALAGLWALAFSTLFGLIRAKLTSPGAPFWGSPFTHSAG